MLPGEYWASDEQLTVDSVEVDGAVHTRPDVFDLLLAPVRRAQSGAQLQAAMKRARDSLQALGILEELDFVLDAARQKRHTRVAVKVVERKRFEYSVGVEAGSSGDVVLRGGLDVRNALGRAEVAHASFSSASLLGLREANTVEASFWKPLLWAEGPRQAWSVAGQLVDTDRTAYAALFERTAGVEAAYHYGSLTMRLASRLSRLSGDPGWSSSAPAMSPSIANREQFGWEPKTAAIAEWRSDTRDSVLAPTVGTLQAASLELAGVPQSMRLLFAKAELWGTHSVPLGATGSLTFRGRLGHIVDLSGGSGPEEGHRHPSVTFVDAFHVAQRMPGFNTHGIGVTANKEDLGACSYWLASAHYLFGLPGAPDFVMGHLHATACAVGGVISSGPEHYGLGTLFRDSSVRASAGAGIVLSLPGMGRLSFILSKVLKHDPRDLLATAVQVSFSSSFD